MTENKIVVVLKGLPIKEKAAQLANEISDIEQILRRKKNFLRAIQEECPHLHVGSPGDGHTFSLHNGGRFFATVCLDCGLNICCRLADSPDVPVAKEEEEEVGKPVFRGQDAHANLTETIDTGQYRFAKEGPNVKFPKDPTVD